MKLFDLLKQEACRLRGKGTRHTRRRLIIDIWKGVEKPLYESSADIFLLREEEGHGGTVL